MCKKKGDNKLICVAELTIYGFCNYVLFKAINKYKVIIQLLCVVVFA